MTSYVPVPAFQTGDILSATKLNQMTTNLDYVYGMDRRPEVGMLTRWWNQDARIWYGWTAYGGEDQLKIYVSLSGTGTCYVVWDDLGYTHAFSTLVTTSGLKTITLPTAQNYQVNQVYRVKVVHGIPLYGYLTSSYLGSIGAMPTFTNGNVSAAADFNNTSLAIDALRKAHDRPFVAQRSYGNNAINPSVADRGTIAVWMQYRHPVFKWLASHSHGSSNRTERLEWSVVKSGNEYVIWTYDLRGSDLPLQIRQADMTSIGLTVGSWYAFTFTHQDADPPNGISGSSSVYWFGQEPEAANASWTAFAPWTYGTVVNGDAGASPLLATFSDNLTWLDTRSRWNSMIQTEGKPAEQWFTRRIKRWLAYENATDEQRVAVRWGENSGIPNQGYELPDAYGTTAYLDMDQSPIRTGQIFYVANSKYAIQVDDPRAGNFI